MTLQEILVRARTDGRAIGHFNISTFGMLRGIVEAARESSAVVMIGTSEGEATFIGYRQAALLVQSFRAEGVQIFLNADHHKSVEAAKTAVDAGYDSIHIDLSKLPYEENVAGTKEVVIYAREKNPEISVEGELGYLPTESSRIYKEEVIIDPASFTKPEEAAKFVQKTGVDRFAAAVGNLHGIAANEPQLDLERIAAIRTLVPDSVALVLHGGSGIPEHQIQEAIQRGMNNVHVSTELRIAYINALRESLAKNPEETTPYKLLPSAVEAVKQAVLQKIILFSENTVR